eukprot:266679-Rhodomonas_salina.1
MSLQSVQVEAPSYTSAFENIFGAISHLRGPGPRFQVRLTAHTVVPPASVKGSAKATPLVPKQPSALAHHLAT